MDRIIARGIECKKCKRKVMYTDTKELLGVGFDFPFRFVGQWYDYQNSLVNSLDLLKMCDEPVYLDTGRFLRVIVYKKKQLISKCVQLALYGDRVEITGKEKIVFPFSCTSAFTVLGRNKLNIYFGDEIYQIKGNKRFCALKYVNFFHRYQNITKGKENEQFLGL